MLYSHLIFDLDGTLIDSAESIFSALLFACEKVDGTSFAQERLTVGPPIKEMINEVASHYSEKQISMAIDLFRESYDNTSWKKFNTYPSVISDLKHFQKLGFKLSIVTNKPLKPTNKILTELGISNLFENIACFNSKVHASKTEVLGGVLELNEQAIMIGDTTADFKAANENNIDFCYCIYGYGNCIQYSIAINKFSDLKNLIL